MKTILLPFSLSNSILAYGGDLKGAFALAKGKRAYLVDGFGDLSRLENFEKFETLIRRYEKKLNIKPRTIACDLHPEYASARIAECYTLYAKRYTLKKIQHHKAHIASAIIDNAIKGEVIGAALDGTGFGEDGKFWGGEFFTGGLREFSRAAHLEYVAVPGMDMAVSQPWRMAASFLYLAYGNKFLDLNIPFIEKLDRKRWDLLRHMIDNNINCPLSSSAGRLFDAVASLVLVKESSRFEAELPIELERAADRSCSGSYDFTMSHKEGMQVINTRDIIKGIVKDLRKGTDVSMISGKFHNTVARIIYKVSARLRKRLGINKVALSGGVFQNKLLSERASEMLRRGGFKVYTHSNIPTTDSGIPIGQIAIAGLTR